MTEREYLLTLTRTTVFGAMVRASSAEEAADKARRGGFEESWEIEYDGPIRVRSVRRDHESTTERGER